MAGGLAYIFDIRGYGCGTSGSWWRGKLPFGRNFWRVKYFLRGAMPELMSERLASYLRHQRCRGQAGMPLAEQNSRKDFRARSSESCPFHSGLDSFLLVRVRTQKNSSPPLLHFLRSRRDESQIFRHHASLQRRKDAAAFCRFKRTGDAGVLHADGSGAAVMHRAAESLPARGFLSWGAAVQN